MTEYIPVAVGDVSLPRERRRCEKSASTFFVIGYSGGLRCSMMRGRWNGTSESRQVEGGRVLRYLREVSGSIVARMVCRFIPAATRGEDKTDRSEGAQSGTFSTERRMR